MTWIMILGLAVAGLTAIPLETELAWVARGLGVSAPSAVPVSGLAAWIGHVYQALHATNTHYPFLSYGYDWLAFGHVVIAIAFVGALRDPVRNRWLFDFGMIACVLIIPWALGFGSLRGIPLGWRVIDCLFGIFGLIPLWIARRDVQELERGGNGLL